MARITLEEAKNFLLTIFQGKNGVIPGRVEVDESGVAWFCTPFTLDNYDNLKLTRLFFEAQIQNLGVEIWPGYHCLRLKIIKMERS